MNAAVREDIFLPFLKRLSLLQAQDDDLVRFIVAGSSLVKLSRGETLCEKGVTPEGVYCLLSGKVKLAVLSFQGNERVVEIIEPGGTFGEPQLFHDEPSPVHAEALANSELVFLHKARVREAARRFPGFALSLLESMAARVHRMVEDVETCCLQNAAMRVSNFLVNHAVFDQGTLDGASVELPACKSVVASTLNLTPETFSRELHRLAGEGLVSVDRRTIHIHNLPGLKSAIAECH